GCRVVPGDELALLIVNGEVHVEGVLAAAGYNFILAPGVERGADHRGLSHAEESGGEVVADVPVIRERVENLGGSDAGTEHRGGGRGDGEKGGCQQHRGGAEELAEAGT